MFSLDENVSLDNDGKPNEGFREEIYYHELVYDESHLVSRWAFDEANGSRIRDLGIAVNDGYLVEIQHWFLVSLGMPYRWMGVATI